MVKQTLKRWWTEWLRSVLLIVLVITSFRSAVADWNDVPSGSMKPTIFEGDRIVVNKLAYDLKIPFTTLRVVSWANPTRGDIVVLYYSPPPPDLVAGPTPGCSGKLIASENFDNRPHAVMIPHGAHCRPTFAPVNVPEDSYFLMGDNRDESFDSRYFGPVRRDRIVGRATVVAASVDPERHYRPRWERFLHPLR
jgi:signal peptidase I